MFQYNDHFNFFHGFIILLSMEQIYAPVTLSNPSYESSTVNYISTNNQWQEVPEPTNIFDVVRNQSSTYQNKGSNVFNLNPVVGGNGYRVLRSNDESMAYVIPSRTVQNTFPIDNDLEDNELETWINQMNEFDNRQNEYVSPSQTIWNNQMFGGWDMSRQSNTIGGYHSLPSQRRFITPTYTGSILYQNRRNSPSISYPNSFITQQTNFPTQRTNLGPPIDIIRQNRYTGFQPNQKTQIYTSNMFIRRPFNSYRRQMFSSYLIPNYQTLNKAPFHGYRSTISSSGNLNYPTLGTTSLYNSTRRSTFS
ncbi:unnamed protein product [Schistosoma spindalis]|nr:unnamed protein product [Schistosoma spindale]